MPQSIILRGDLFNTKAKYICHQVNCCGKMGSGIAKQVRQKFPEAYSAYMDLCRASDFKKGELLGKAQLCPTVNGTTIINMFAQGDYGYDGGLYTNYVAFRQCLGEICALVPEGETIAMPYKIGCGLGGGDWDTIRNMIVVELSNKYIVEFWIKEAL